MADIRALSVRRPFADLLVDGVKPVENRSWTTSYRGLLVIHAGQRWEKRGQLLAAEQGTWVERATYATGYLGTVELVNVHLDAGCCAPWGESGTGYHWVVKDPRRFETPIPGNGRLGLYVPPAEVLELITKEATRG